MSPLDPRSPLVLDTKGLRRRAGVMEEKHLDVTLADEMGTDVIAVPAGDPMAVDLRLEAVLEGVLVSGTADATARGACVRCLEPMSEALTAHFQELFVYADRAAHHHEVSDDEEDQYMLEGDLLDLEPMIRDAVVLRLPFQPVCAPDCPGLCSECGQPLADDPDHAHEIIDPRWASLQGLLAEGSEAPADQKKRN